MESWCAPAFPCTPRWHEIKLHTDVLNLIENLYEVINEYVSFIIKYIYNIPATIDNITNTFIDQFCVDAAFDDVRCIIQNYICFSKHSKNYFREYANHEGSLLPPLLFPERPIDMYLIFLMRN